jgi:hypothetical protein
MDTSTVILILHAASTSRGVPNRNTLFLLVNVLLLVLHISKNSIFLFMKVLFYLICIIDRIESFDESNTVGVY